MRVAAILRLVLMTIAIAAIAYQFGHLYGRPTFSPGNFFSFFTIQSNILAIVLLELLAVVRPEERTPRRTSTGTRTRSWTCRSTATAASRRCVVLAVAFALGAFIVLLVGNRSSAFRIARAPA